MIFDYIIATIFQAIGFILSVLPQASQLPFGTDSFFASGVGGFRALSTVFPPFITFLNVFMWYIVFKIGIIFLNAIMGNRSPAKHL